MKYRKVHQNAFKIWRKESRVTTPIKAWSQYQNLEIKHYQFASGSLHPNHCSFVRLAVRPPSKPLFVRTSGCPTTLQTTVRSYVWPSDHPPNHCLFVRLAVRPPSKPLFVRTSGRPTTLQTTVRSYVWPSDHHPNNCSFDHPPWSWNRGKSTRWGAWDKLSVNWW